MAKELTKKEESAVANIDDLRKEYAGAGMDQMEQEDIRPPRLKLAQALTPELDDIDELKAGKFFNNITQKIYPSMRIIPIKFFKTFVLFAPRDSGESVLARADDGKHWNPPDLVYEHPTMKGVEWKTAKTVKASGLGEFGSSNPADSNSPPAATKYMNFLCIDADDPDAGPFVFSFYRSGIKAGGDFASQMRSSGVAWNNIYELKAVEVHGGKGKYFVPKTRAVDKTPDDLWMHARTIFEALKDKSIVVEQDNEEVEEIDENESAEGAF